MDLCKGETTSKRRVYLPVGTWSELTTCTLDQLISDTSECETIHESEGKFVQVEVTLENCPFFRRN